MRRRALLASASALGGLWAVDALAATIAPPGRSLRQLGGRQVWLPIGFRGRGVNGSAAYFDAVSTQVMDRTAWWAPSFGAVTAMRLVYARFDMPQQGEVDRPVSGTLTAAVEAPGPSNAITATQLGAQASASATLAFSPTGAGVNGITAGQGVTSNGGGVPAGTYVTSVGNSFVAGSGSAPASTSVTLSAALTAAAYNTQPFVFAGSALVPAYFGGQRAGALTPAHDVLISDPMPVELPASAPFFVRSWASLSGPGMQIMDYPGVQSGSTTRLAGEASTRGTAVADATLAPTMPANTGGGYFCPVAVLGLVTLGAGQPQPGAVLIVGDSIVAGTGDNMDAGGLGIMGYVQRSLGNAVPWISAARGSTLAYGEAASGRGQYALSVDTGITDVFLELNRNDLESLQLAASVTETAVAQAGAPYLAAGKRVWPFTCPPSTYSSDGWTSLANQGFPAAAQALAAAVASGSTTATLAGTTSVATGQVVTQGATSPALSAGTTVSSISGSVVTLSSATIGTIAAGSKLYFGTQSASASTVEVQRQAYNSFMRGSATALGLQPVIDIDGVVADPSGKWKVYPGATAGTIDGVHPSPVAHSAAVAAGIIPVSSIVP